MPQCGGCVPGQRGREGIEWIISSCLVSTPARPTLDAHQVPPETNEMGAFGPALETLLTSFGRTLFDLVMEDASACSLANATLVKSLELD